MKRSREQFLLDLFNGAAEAFEVAEDRSGNPALSAQYRTLGSVLYNKFMRRLNYPIVDARGLRINGRDPKLAWGTVLIENLPEEKMHVKLAAFVDSLIEVIPVYDGNDIYLLTNAAMELELSLRQQSTVRRNKVIADLYDTFNKYPEVLPLQGLKFAIVGDHTRD